MRSSILRLALVVAVTAPTVRAQPAAGPATLPQTEVLEIVSESGDPYRVFVAPPQSAPPAGGFPVVYVLDANAVFGTVTETARLQDGRNGLGAALVVGVGYPTDEPFDVPRRLVDYTPRPPASDAVARGRQTGGADTFFRVLDEQIRPAIEAAYPVDRGRQTLAGHSLGGLFVLHTLAEHPASFARYVIASPSVWWGGTDEDLATIEAADCLSARVLVTVGMLEQTLSEARAAGLSDEARAVREGQLAERAMVDNTAALADRLGGVPGLDVTFVPLDGETHLSSLGVAMSRAVRFALAP